MARSLLDSTNLTEWLQKIRFDFDSPGALAHSVIDWLAEAPASVLVTIAAITVAALAFTRRTSAAVLIVLLALGMLSAVGMVL
jgi:hypothetical protein